MSEFKIEKDVPLPVRSRWPWREMEIGDSVYFACPPGTPIRKFSAQVGTHMYQVRNRKFTRRIVGEGVRVWRIK